MITYSWKIISFQKRDRQFPKSFVISAIWEKIGIDDNNYTGRFLSENWFDPNNLNEDELNCINFLQENIVINLIKKTIGKQKEEYINAEIIDQINKKYIYNKK